MSQLLLIEVFSASHLDMFHSPDNDGSVQGSREGPAGRAVAAIQGPAHLLPRLRTPARVHQHQHRQEGAPEPGVHQDAAFPDGRKPPSPARRGRLELAIHTRAPTFIERREECLKNCYAPKNGSRGREFFKGGENQIFAEENRDFCENMRKKSKDFLAT